MKKATLITVIAAFVMLWAQPIRAEVKLPAIVLSNMVLQRNATVVLWGWADANENITIETSWLNEDLGVQAYDNGDWRVEVETTSSKKAQTIQIKCKDSNITLGNVVFGEVWLCSGQSNMQQPLRGYTGQPTYGSGMATAKTANPDLRLFTVDWIGSKTPLKDVEEFKAWQQASPENVWGFSAVAYFFGKQLQEILDVPVGMDEKQLRTSSVFGKEVPPSAPGISISRSLLHS